MYSFSYLEPVCCSMSSSNCCLLTCTGQEAGQVVWYSHLLQNFPQFIVIHTVKACGIVNKAGINDFLNFLAFAMIQQMDVGNLISGSSAFSKTSLNIRKFTVHLLLKPGLENFKHHFTSECCCCCQVTSVVSDSVLPHRQQPTRLPRPWDSPGENTGVGCHFLRQCVKVKSESEVTQPCPTLGDPVGCSPPGSSIHGLFQARVLESGAIEDSNKITSEKSKRRRHGKELQKPFQNNSQNGKNYIPINNKFKCR